MEKKRRFEERVRGRGKKSRMRGTAEGKRERHQGDRKLGMEREGQKKEGRLAFKGGEKERGVSEKSKRS